jgi:cysteine desulfurase/selenocysteine lyase
VTTAAATCATEAPATLDVERVRADFPALNQTVHGHRLAYLDNAATTQKPSAVIDAVSALYSSDYGNVHRGVHQLSQRATAAFEGARGTVQRHLGARRPSEIVFVRGTTEAINLVAMSFVRPRLEAGDEIVISAMEHHSNIVPWQMVCAESGARLRIVPMSDRGELDLDAYRRLLGERTRMVSLVHVSNALGTVNPIQEMVAAARARGVPVLIDGAQAVPHTAVDVVELGCDFYAFSGHKAYGPAGVGALYGRHQLLASMIPYQGGGEMITSVSFEHTEYAAPPHRFEAGTPNIEGAVGLGAALEYLQHLGLESIATHESELLTAATAAVSSIPGVRLIGTAAHKAGVLGFVLEGVHPHDIGTILDQRGVAVRAGHHCAQPVMAHYGVPATVRASFGVYNGMDDVEALVAALHEVKEVFS